MNIDDCLKILELKPGASIDEIKTARVELLQVWHPDKFASNPKLSEKAKEKTLKINEAFNILVKDLNLTVQKHKSQSKQSAQKNNDTADFQKELQRYSKKQEARLNYQDRRNNQKKHAKRQLNFTILYALLTGLFGLILGLREWTFFLTPVVLIIGLVVSFLTYRKPIKKTGSRR